MFERPLSRQLLASVLALLLSATAAAQRQGDVVFELGFAGEVVAGAWNPLRVRLRDHRGAILEVRIDQGSLREGVIPLVYRADLGGGTGLTVFEDDIYVPPWRSLSWQVRSGDTTIASGSYAAGQRLDDRPLHLLLSSDPGGWRGLYRDGDRLSEVAALDLPERAAAYDGVASLLIDGSAVAPRLGAVAAAAGAGVVVRMTSNLPGSHRDLDLLATTGAQRLGEGWLLRGDPLLAVKQLAALPQVDGDRMIEVLAAADPLSGPAAVPQLFVLIAAAAYGLLTLVLVRFAGIPGLLAAAGLAAVVSVAAWRALRPAQPLQRSGVVVEIGGGDLAHRVAIERLFTLPAGRVQLPGSYRPLHTRPLDVGPAGTELSLERWQAETLVARPLLVPALLVWEDGLLVNRSGRTLDALIVQGLGPQPPLPAGARRAPSLGEERSLGPTLEALLAAVPAGTAVAQIGERFVLALPALDAIPVEGG